MAESVRLNMGSQRGSSRIRMRNAEIRMSSLIADAGCGSWTGLVDMKSIAKQAFALPADERAKLALELIESLDAPGSEESMRVWLEEAARRSAAVDAGSVELIDGEVAAARARGLLK
ncbi:MAG: addiction module protein [Proteobacteria bacterium]|nr:addiction module protein [Pseudomonadota bacterium]